MVTPPQVLLGSPLAVQPSVEPVTVCPQARGRALAQRSLGGVTTKLAADTPGPPGPVTVMGPVVVPTGTVTVICVAELTVKITTVPGPPAAGEKMVMVGAGITVKLVAEVPLAMGLVTVMGPVMAPAGTVTVIWVPEFTVKLVVLMPPNDTPLAPRKLVPVMTTVVPGEPLVGVKLVTVGGLPTTKLWAEVAVPPGTVTVMVPVVVPAPTVAVICVAEFTTNVAGVPLNDTAVAPVKPPPRMVTTVPACPPPGEKLVITGPGAATMEKLAFEMSKK